MEKELSFLSRNEAVRRMNEWGKERRPFVFVIDYKQERSLVEEPEGIDPSVCLYDFCGVTNAGGSAFAPYTQDIRWQAFPESESRFAGAFEVVRRNLLAGNSFLVNLTRKVPIDTNLSLEEMFHRSRAPYRLWLRGRFVCFSPEIFVRIRGGNIFAYPMKGTIDAALPDAQQALREDEKEAAEHATVVDLLRNDLSMYATGVTVFRYRYFDRLVTNRGVLWQTSSEIGGRLPGDYREHLGDLLYDMLPAGSVTGAPKPKTMEIIAEAEGYERGFYTGIAGYFDGSDLDSCVLIRFVEQEGDRLWFKAGGGITSRSSMHGEYEEVKQKVYVPIY